MIDDDVQPVDDPPVPVAMAVARRADRSAQSARVDRSQERREIRVYLDDDEPEPFNPMPIVGTVALVAVGVAVLVLAVGVLGGCWMIALPLMAVAALLKSGRPTTGH